MPRDGAATLLQTPRRVMAAGGLLIGVADLAFAFAFWWSRGVTPPRILQSIAAGVLGRDSYSGGAATAALGAVLHFSIATAFVLACALALRWWPRLARRPVASGLAYGVLLYLAMHLVVLPLSAAGMPRFDDLPWVASSIAMHMAIGVACVVFARRAIAAGGLSARRPAP